MHTAFIGQTGSGKTYHAVKTIQKHLEADISVVIYNPQKQVFPNHENCKSFSTAKGFYDYLDNLKTDKKILMYIDESATLLASEGDERFNTFMTTARHKGWVLLSVQRPIKIITPSVLSQCSNFIIFKIVYEKDQKFIANTLNIDLKTIKNIPRYHYIKKLMTA